MIDDRDLQVEITNAFCWKFTDVPKIDNGIVRSNDRIEQLKTDFNIGFEKSECKVVLENLECLTRENAKISLSISTKITPVKSPHYLDDELDFIKFPKISYNSIKIIKVKKGRNINVIDNELIIKMDCPSINEFFVKIYTVSEIYATHEDNIMFFNKDSLDSNRLVIWGVINGKPIHY